MSDSARASMLPIDYSIPYRRESTLRLTFLVRDLSLVRRLRLSSCILFGIECIAEKSGLAVDRLGRPPFSSEDLFAFPVVVNVTLWWKNCRICGAKITRTLGVAQCRVVSGACGGAPSRVFLPLRARGGFRGKRKVCNGGPSGFWGTDAIRGGRWQK